MSAAAPLIPFEAQQDPHARRDCGAACLSMVYRSFGVQTPAAEIWAAIARPNASGGLASTTHRMVRDALARGFSAVAIQARFPLQVLRLCRDSGVRAILNHRLAADSREGHYTVLVDLDERDAILHDPFRGPMCRVPHAELLDLWLPRVPGSEIFGNVLIGVAREPGEAAGCWLCRTRTPAAIDCPKCGKPVGLRPGAVLGCANGSCVARLWNAVCCPACDCMFTFGVDLGGATESRILYAPEGAESGEEAAPASPADEQDPFQLMPVFAEIDKFITQVVGIPGLANHAEIRRQLDLMAARKMDLKLAMTEAVTNRALVKDRWSKLQEMTRRNAEASRQRQEQAARAIEPLDGNALGRALMKNLGFIR